LVVKGQVVRFQAAYVSEGEIRKVVTKLSGGQRQSRRWADEAEQLATGTDGRSVGAVVKPGESKRRRLGLMFGQQLRLIK
jgi:hypothetical protein